MKYICDDCQNEIYKEPCILDLQLKPSVHPHRCPFGFNGGTWSEFKEAPQQDNAAADKAFCFGCIHSCAYYNEECECELDR